jgi:hypothetical protein
MHSLRASLKWWVFLPLAPVVFLLLLDASYAGLSYFRLYWLASVIDAIEIFVTVVSLAPYWSVSILLFGTPWSTPYPLWVAELMIVGVLFSAVLFVFDVVFTIAFRGARPHDNI